MSCLMLLLSHILGLTTHTHKLRTEGKLSYWINKVQSTSHPKHLKKVGENVFQVLCLPPKSPANSPTLPLHFTLFSFPRYGFLHSNKQGQLTIMQGKLLNCQYTMCCQNACKYTDGGERTLFSVLHIEKCFIARMNAVGDKMEIRVHRLSLIQRPPCGGFQVEIKQLFN